MHCTSLSEACNELLTPANILPMNTVKWAARTKEHLNKFTSYKKMNATCQMARFWIRTHYSYCCRHSCSGEDLRRSQRFHHLKLDINEIWQDCSSSKSMESDFGYDSILWRWGPRHLPAAIASAGSVLVSRACFISLFRWMGNSFMCSCFPKVNKSSLV